MIRCVVGSTECRDRDRETQREREREREGEQGAGVVRHTDTGVLDKDESNWTEESERMVKWTVRHHEALHFPSRPL